MWGAEQTRRGGPPSFAIMAIVRGTSIQPESTRRADASVARINGHATDSGLVYSRHNVGLAEMFQHGTRELADHLQRWPLPVRAQQLGTENSPHSEFITVFSHELRNSLGAIRAATHILRMENSPGPAVVKARALIERQVEQMTRLVEDLLDVSRVRGGHLRLQCARIDLCAVAAHAAQTVEFAMQQRNHRMTTIFPDAPVWLQADPTRLEQVLVNLLINAAKYTEAGGKVELSVERQEDEAIVSIRDTGIGIAPDVLPHVFDLFVQANPFSRSADAGLGIGLALVRSLVESHGGRVTAASAGLRHGSEFTVRLPMHAE